MSCCHGGMGVPFSVCSRCHGYGTLPLDVYNLIIYFVIGVCHPERGGAMSLLKTSVQWESCGCRTADVGE